MSNFSKCFYDLIMTDPETMEMRVQHSMEVFDINADDAYMLDNALLAACRTTHRVMGAKIDGLPEHLRIIALRLFLGTLGQAFSNLQQLVYAQRAGLPAEVAGWAETPNCSCSTCKRIDALRNEIKALPGGYEPSPLASIFGEE